MGDASSFQTDNLWLDPTFSHNGRKLVGLFGAWPLWASLTETSFAVITEKQSEMLMQNWLLHGHSKNRFEKHWCILSYAVSSPALWPAPRHYQPWSSLDFFWGVSPTGYQIWDTKGQRTKAASVQITKQTNSWQGSPGPVTSGWHRSGDEGAVAILGRIRLKYQGSL